MRLSIDKFRIPHYRYRSTMISRLFASMLLSALIIILYQSPSFALDHAAHFDQLPADYYMSIESYYTPSTDWYRCNYNMAKYSGYQDLLIKYNRYLPTGKGLVILQAESSHTPDRIGDVKHLFTFKSSDSHSEYVADLLSTENTYTLSYTRYTTFSIGLDHFHTADTADLRTFCASASSSNTYPAASYDHIPVSPAKLLNVSNTNGGSSAITVREFDRFVQLNDMVACTAHSSLIEGNWTTSGMAYNSVVVGQPYVNTQSFAGAEINDHGAPRFKPDLIAISESYATSYSSPTVCSAAAMLLERVQVDPLLTNAWNSVVLKAILMAGATRFNYKISTEWGNGISQANLPLFTQGEWQRESDAQPTSYKYGAGTMNVLASYNILEGGEFDPNPTNTVGNQGWDFADHTPVGQTNVYRFALQASSMFTSVLVWHRVIDDDLNSFLPDYSVAVYDVHNNRVAFSDNLTSNVELIETKLSAGEYRMEVRAKSNGGVSGGMSYGLAWIAKELLPSPAQFLLQRTGSSIRLRWNVTRGNVGDYKYRVETSTDPNFLTVEDEVYTDNPYLSNILPEELSSRYYRVYTYPKDGNVAYYYPSASTTVLNAQWIQPFPWLMFLPTIINHAN